MRFPRKIWEGEQWYVPVPLPDFMCRYCKRFLREEDNMCQCDQCHLHMPSSPKAAELGIPAAIMMAMALPPVYPAHLCLPWPYLHDWWRTIPTVQLKESGAGRDSS